MRIVLWLAIAASLYGGWQWWQDRPGAALANVEPSPNGFVPVEMPRGAPRNAVLVLTPPNCPSEQARRAESLIAALSSQGIAVRRASGIDYSFSEAPTAEQRQGVDRAIQVFNQGAPAVFINGMAMSNPSVEQAVAEYRRTRRGS
ncbi:MAG: hypothetical protein GX761_08175 [Gammaproteobacteria bacterium]|nr:hypothetical protein [Gammaproteobacteria bacterium]